MPKFWKEKKGSRASSVNERSYSCSKGEGSRIAKKGVVYVFLLTYLLMVLCSRIEII